MKSTLILIVAATCLCGCPRIERRPESCVGPTQPMAQVVEEINRNNASIRTIRAAHNYEALIYDQKGKSHQFSGDGYLLFRKPDDLLLTAKVLTEQAFTVGSNAERYWFTVPRENTMWWGTKANFTPEKAKEIPIRPDLLLEVLGVLDVDTNFKQPPAPVMRFNSDTCSYMFVWSVPLTDRWAAVKEVWYDRATKLPSLVLLFDENGRVILRAYLSEHTAVPGTTGKIATRFNLFFPENKTQMSFHLRDVQQSITRGKVTIPNDASFAFPDEPGVDKLIEIK